MGKVSRTRHGLEQSFVLRSECRSSQRDSLRPRFIAGGSTFRWHLRKPAHSESACVFLRLDTDDWAKATFRQRHPSEVRSAQCPTPSPFDRE